MTGDVTIEVVTTSGRAARVDLKVTPANVEVWRAKACVARVDTWQVQQWLASPTGTLSAGDVAINFDASLDRDHPRVAVTLPDVTAWSLSPGEHDAFVDAVRRAHT